MQPTILRVQSKTAVNVMYPTSCLHAVGGGHVHPDRGQGMITALLLRQPHDAKLQPKQSQLLDSHVRVHLHHINTHGLHPAQV